METVSICKAQQSDIAKVVDVHLACFKDSFSSSLGKKILSSYYESYLKHSSDLFLVAKFDEKIVGFVVGYCCENKQAFAEFKKKNLIRIILRVICRLLIFDKRVYRKIFRKPGETTVLLPSFCTIERNKMGDLLSICVLPEYRKNNIASNLENEFNKSLLTLNRKYCVLSCLVSNDGGNRFYEKLCYSVYRKNKLNNYYVRELNK